MSNDEIHARNLNDGQFFREDGLDEVHHITKIVSRGDAMLIDCGDGCELTIDGDEVVEVMDFAPVNIAGQITLANGRSVHFTIGNVAGDINFSQWGDTEQVLYNTVPLLDGLVEKINEDELLVIPHD